MDPLGFKPYDKCYLLLKENAMGEIVYLKYE